MINDLDINLCPLSPLEFQTNQQQLISEQFLDENCSKKCRVSSQCLLFKKYYFQNHYRKIRHKKSRPSILRIEEVVRNVKIYNNCSSQQNLENLEIIQNKPLVKSG
ncbi:unnamed protein product (macronuclear) [Paramecium tetraurelia]|uniref:C2H2-type domain-containing protein n=1 Tax=Paramecium tetraurelia TaxID=5888 RepID=A0CKH8_PARTE|nr:uncharacterized protein GSPATT00001009001 [Paramecium tetraurelia]CAK71295.1 unnamed protein product [Paramecium tetraurelia]|eukprot:XP_001438692.1 hypothetical protein (macronuclear) [Paramecium tetraurelia strain d4-2]